MSSSCLLNSTGGCQRDGCICFPPFLSVFLELTISDCFCQSHPLYFLTDALGDLTSYYLFKEEPLFFYRQHLWKEHELTIWLSACWESEYEEARFLISDRPASPKRVKEYGRRMRVEATFEDQKSRGFLIECSQFNNRDHLNRWLFAVYLATWWIAHLGSSCIHHGHREQVDRKDRRDKGLLRIGRLWLKAILKRANRALFRRENRGQVKAQLLHCLLFAHRRQCLSFSIYLH